MFVDEVEDVLVDRRDAAVVDCTSVMATTIDLYIAISIYVGY